MIGPYKYLIIGGAIIAFGGFMFGFGYNVASDRAERVAAEIDRQALEQQAADLQRIIEQTEEANRELGAINAQRDRLSREIMRRGTNESVGPGITAVLDGLRSRETAATPSD